MVFVFYDVKDRKKVHIREENLLKTAYRRRLKAGRIQVRYALRAKHDGRWLTKFCTKAEFDRLNIPLEVKVS